MTSKHITFTKAEIRAIMGSLYLAGRQLPLDHDTRQIVTNLINKLKEVAE